MLIEVAAMWIQATSTWLPATSEWHQATSTWPEPTLTCVESSRSTRIQATSTRIPDTSTWVQANVDMGSSLSSPVWTFGSYYLADSVAADGRLAVAVQKTLLMDAQAQARPSGCKRWCMCCTQLIDTLLPLRETDFRLSGFQATSTQVVATSAVGSSHILVVLNNVHKNSSHVDVA